MKWIYAAITVLAIGLGLSVDNRVQPNQQISLQFQTGEHHNATIETTISRLTEQLQYLGATHIEVRELNKGEFKIAYYSSLSTVIIHNSLETTGAISQNRFLTIGLETASKESPIPSSEDDYQFSISVIQSASKDSLGFEGVLVETQQGAEAIFHANAHSAITFTSLVKNTFFVKVTSSNFAHQTLEPSILQYQIPEVRAGPIF